MLTLAPAKTRHQVVVVLIGINVLWLCTGLLAIAFQCGLPNTWKVEFGDCVDQVGKLFQADPTCR